MLDTNVWSYLGDQGAAAEFDAFVRSRGATVVVPPSVLLEVLRLPKPDKRDRILRALLGGPRRRLTSEADLESAEVVAEVRRLRPHWMRAVPDTGREAGWRTFWTKKVWRRAKEHPGAFLDVAPAVGTERVAEHLVEQQRQQRAEVDRARATLDDLSAMVMWQDPDGGGAGMPGWRPGDRVEPWRVHNREVYWQALAVVGPRSVLTHEDSTLADWVGARVDLRAACADPADFTAFWLYEAEASRMPRNWLRWAADIAQADMRIGPGNPYDAQHSAYLPDCDIFLTADKNYVRVLDRLAAHAPVPIARARRVAPAAHSGVVDAVRAALEEG
ncbi:type II toxin-antitoxin system VapC family toxin [Streptomyces sp. CA-132043]|uniref:type II toxin-antitoxin system VapC family toxin n=1 Tax=Streptomyces sp. CA-132043 TaxID=3240048 RepID=UPI003D8ADCFE